MGVVWSVKTLAKPVIHLLFVYRAVSATILQQQIPAHNVILSKIFVKNVRALSASIVHLDIISMRLLNAYSAVRICLLVYPALQSMTVLPVIMDIISLLHLLLMTLA